ncbi:hypothetical protein ACP4OV_012390 [Aristida adscensionis]
MQQQHQGDHSQLSSCYGGGGNFVDVEANQQEQHQLPPVLPLGSVNASPGGMSAEVTVSAVGAPMSCVSAQQISLMDLTRVARIPRPEPGLQCPRCMSTDTKFCYFNNYSLSQPRYFCRTCRRFWTKGGVVRDLPFNNGARRRRLSKRNQITKSTSSPVASAARSERSSLSSASATATSASSGATKMERKCSGFSRLWSPGHSSLAPLSHQLGDTGATATFVGHEQWRQPLGPQHRFFSHTDATSSHMPAIQRFPTEGSTEAAGVATLRTHLAAVAEMPSSAVLVTQLESLLMDDSNELAMTTWTNSQRNAPGHYDNLQFLGGGSGASAYGGSPKGRDEGTGTVDQGLSGFNISSGFYIT